ncbi:MAG TPA: hypothetical protein VFM18_21920 [Methanosarcina sp.]|nr:hypothetical protein [Methanosarcina sp.]
MALNSNKVGGGNGGGNRVEQPVIDAGVYPARIAQVIDMGLQPQRPYKGQDKPPAPEVMLTYELVDTFMVDENGEELEDKPRFLSEILPLHNLKADKAKSTQRYLAADPNNVFNGDFSKIVDAAVNVAVVHNQVGEKTYVNIASIAAMRAKDADKCPALKNEPKVFDLDEPDMEIFSSLPQWIQDKIKANLNYQGSALQTALEGAPKKEKKAEAPKKEEEPKDEQAPWD